jgi:hypothetical protein
LGCGVSKFLEVAPSYQQRDVILLLAAPRPSQDRWVLEAVRVPKPARGIIVVGKEQGCMAALRSILEEKLIHGTEGARRVMQRHGVLTAQVGLQIRHQQTA